MESTRSAKYGEVSIKTDHFWLGDCRRLHGDSGTSLEIQSIYNCSFLKITSVVFAHPVSIPLFSKNPRFF